MLLNCDLGESNGDNIVGDDDAIMPHIDQANIACGFHGGDPLTLQRCIALAREHGVSLGAHPSYPDRQGFGRRSMSLPAQQLQAVLHYQIAALEGMAASGDMQLSHVKPHGALYNDMMADDTVRHAVMEALAAYHRRYTLVLQSTADWEQHLAEAESRGLELLFEAFADRRYLADGSLQARSIPGAVLSGETMLEQARMVCTQGQVVTAEGTTLALHAQTLCVHGDSPGAAEQIRAIRQIVGAD
ncbi:MAG: 5-oxoprolinase subunit PxpA [Halioglobus sp.]